MGTSAQCRVLNRDFQDALSRMCALSDQLWKRFLFSYIMENAVQVNLQSSILAINSYASLKLNNLALFSIILGLFLTFIKLLEARSFFLLVECMEEQVATKEAAEGALDERSKIQVRDLRWSTRIIKVLCT